MLWIAMEQHSSSLDTGKGMFSDLLSEMCVASPAMFDHLERATHAAFDDADINHEEREDLLRLLEARKLGDEETIQSIILKYNPHLLLAIQRAQAVVDHHFRIANHCKHRCENLRVNAHRKCVECARQPGEDCLQPTTICPAREAEESVSEPAEMVA